MTLNCAIFYQEEITSNTIENHINRTPYLSLAQKFKHYFDAFTYLAKNQVDILFMDDELPDSDRVRLVGKLDYKPAVIFTARDEQNFDEHKEDNIIDCLSKPINYNQFIDATVKAIKWNYNNQNLSPQNQYKQFLFIKSEYKIIRIELDSILYIEGMNEYVRIHRVGKKPIMTLLSLKSIEKQLPKGNFMRVHKSYIVNLNLISEIESNTIICEDGKLIPVSKLYKEPFQSYLKDNFIV